MNRTILVGRITKDPELKATTNGISVCQFTIAVNRTYTQNGEREADFIQCVAWRNQAENLAKYVSKGNLIGIDGRLQIRTYETDQGTRYITEVICGSVQFLESKKEEQPIQRVSQSNGFVANQDDLPF